MMDQARLSQLLDDYFDSALERADKLELEHLLLQYPAARECFWRRAEWDALMQEWGEQHWGAEGLKLLPALPQRRWWRWIAAGVAAAACVVAMLVWKTREVPPRETPVAVKAAVLRYASAPQWADDLDLAPGDRMPHGPMKLAAGFVTIELGSGAQVSVQGPAEWTVTSANSLRLDLGCATAQVPAPARGFRFTTPVGDVVDFGTVFGVKVNADGTTSTHVFEGRVELRAGGAAMTLTSGMALTGSPRSIAFTSSDADARAFPTVERRLGEMLVGGSFEPGLLFGVGAMPNRPGMWRGDLCEVVEARDGVAPRDGKVMLRFVRADNGSAPTRGTPRTGSEQWQLVDLRAVRRAANVTGPLIAESGASFNTGRQHSAVFGVKLVAWRGSIAHVKQAWTNALAAPEAVLGTADSHLTSDRDPQTWERASVSLTIPPEADLLLVAVSSFDNTVSFPSNFVDDVSLTLSAPPQPALAVQP